MSNTSNPKRNTDYHTADHRPQYLQNVDAMIRNSSTNR